MARKVIIIEDSQTIRHQIGTLLMSEGYAIVEATDGVDGLEKLHAESDAALAVCDINMPRMDGIEMIEKLKAEGATAPPLLVLTTEGQATLVARARAAGAKGWITKPFKPDMLVAAVRKLAGPP